MIDFLIVGGGIAGLSAAARLSELGSVTVLEAERSLGYHASGRSAAMFEETYGKPSTIALNRASRHWHLEVNGSKDLPRGLMLLGSRGTEEAFASDFENMLMRSMSLEDAQAMVPILDPEFVTDIGYHAEAWDIDTDAAMTRFTKMAKANGAEVITDAAVTRIDRDKRWIVTAGDTTFEAHNIVNAAGAWADEIAKLAGIAPLALQPLRRSMARVEAPAGYDVGKWPMLFGPGETWYAKPDAGALLISPADEDPVVPQDAWAEDMVLAEGIARYQPHVTAEVTRLIANWAGLRTFAPDRTLVLGPDPETPEFVWCAGQGGYGMQTSPAASQLLADLVGGRKPEIDEDAVAALRPDRLRRR